MEKMNFEEKLNYLGLDKNYTEKELITAYKRKQTELNEVYEALRLKLQAKDTISFQQEMKERFSNIMKNIFFNPNIDVEAAKKLFIPLISIERKIEKGKIDPTLMAYLDNLKLDGSEEDILLLSLISKGIDPYNEEEIDRFLLEQAQPLDDTLRKS